LIEEDAGEFEVGVAGGFGSGGGVRRQDEDGGAEAEGGRGVGVIEDLGESRQSLVLQALDGFEVLLEAGFAGVSQPGRKLGVLFLPDIDSGSVDAGGAGGRVEVGSGGGGDEDLCLSLLRAITGGGDGHVRGKVEVGEFGKLVQEGGCAAIDNLAFDRVVSRC
jgi:hypothetical protein